MENISAEIKGYIHRGIESAEVDEGGHLVFTLTDGSVCDLGCISDERKYEHIATVSIDQDASRIDISADSEGKPFKLTKLRAYFTVPAVDPADYGKTEQEGISGMLTVKLYNDSNSIANVTVSDGVSSSSTRQILLTAEQRGGLWDHLAACGAIPEKTLVRGNDFETKEAALYPYISRLLVSKVGGIYIPAGSKAELWGVRGD